MEIQINTDNASVHAVATPSGDLFEYEYDEGGRVTVIVFRGEPYREFAYDSTWLKRVTTPLLDTCFRSYLDGHLVEALWRDVLNSTLRRVRYNYDSTGRPTDAATESVHPPPFV